MSVGERVRQTMPRSALRYRPITADLTADQHTHPPSRVRARARVKTAPAVPDHLEHEEAVSRQPRITSVPRTRPKKTRLHPWLLIGMGTLITLILWVAVVQVLAWGSNMYNNIVYGSPRTFQIDAVVGQGDSSQHPSHFIAVNLHGIVTILDFPAGDASHVRALASYSVPGPDAEQAVATLRFLDVEHNGRPAMIITVDGLQSILINDGRTFRQPTPGEQQQVLQALEQSHA